jgi:hypothetical protein
MSIIIDKIVREVWLNHTMRLVLCDWCMFLFDSYYTQRDVSS